MRVFLANTSFAPDYGGPAISVPRLGEALAEAGATVGLWAPDGTATLPGSQQNAAELQRFDGDLTSAFRAFGAPDIIHDNGLWRPHNHALSHLAHRQGVPRVVSPRGMLEPAAFGHKRIKKRLAWVAYQRRDLSSAQAMHVTSDKEYNTVTRYGLGVTSAIIPNGVDLPATLSRADTQTGTLTALFVSRVHPLKGLPMLVEAWAQLRPAGWRLVIAGPSENGHADEVAALAKARGLGEREIEMIGPTYGEAKKALFAEADLFILPTHTENFAMAVAEALAHGLPVLTTTGAPWEEIIKKRCGWWVEPTPEHITNALTKAIATPVAELRAMGERGRSWMAHDYGWDRVARQCLDLYATLQRDHAS